MYIKGWGGLRTIIERALGKEREEEREGRRSQQRKGSVSPTISRFDSMAVLNHSERRDEGDPSERYRRLEEEDEDGDDDVQSLRRRRRFPDLLLPLLISHIIPLFISLGIRISDRHGGGFPFVS